MSFRDITRLRETARLAREVATMCELIADQQEAHDKAYAEWDYRSVSRYLGPEAPSPARTGAARRRSMDLTRALAALRRSI